MNLCSPGVCSLVRDVPFFISKRGRKSQEALQNCFSEDSPEKWNQ